MFIILIKEYIFYSFGIKNNLSNSMIKTPGPGSYENKSTVLNIPSMKYS